MILINSNKISGIFNCGTGTARSFNDLSLAIINAYRKADGYVALDLQTVITHGILEYIPFPVDLADKYQCFIQSNNNILTSIGKYKQPFLIIEQGDENYVSLLLRL